MTRTPDAEIERLKATVNLVELVEASGIVLERRGADRVGLCPFHDDHEPSLVVTPEKNLWHCFGCGVGGSPLDWVMKWNGVSFRHAVELLRTDPALAAHASRPLKISRVRRLPSPLSLDVEDRELLNQVIGYYHATLKNSPEALAYLAKRGLTHSAMVEHFQLGYSNRTLGLRLPVKATKPGHEVRGRLQGLGLLRESGHEHFAGSLIIPVFDAQGQVTEVYGRKLRDDLRPGTPLHLYLPGPHHGVWNVEALQASKEIILCEALIDALTFWCAGFRNVTACYGVNGFTDDHLAAFKKHGTERVLIAYDRDDAGERATVILARQLIAAGIDCYRLHFPKGMDTNSYALRVQPAEKSLSVVIHTATWLGKGQTPARDGAAVLVEPSESLLESESKHKAPAASLAAAPLASSTESLSASPTTPPQADIEAQVNGDTVTIQIGDRRYRIRGLAQNLGLNQMKVSVLVSRGGAFHVDIVELRAARQRALYAAQAAKELNVNEDVIAKDLGKLFLKLEELQEQNLQNTLEPKDKTVALTAAEQHAALDLLRDPRLLDRILADFAACGMVGEEVNKLVGYLAATSRKLDHPLAVIVQSASAAGKSALMEAVLAMMPEEDKVQYSAITGQALYYMSSINLQHKILALAEEAGAARASYALKLLQSEGVLKIASTGKNPETGELVTQTYKVEGPVMIFSTTTAIDNDEELLNRCLTLGVDESREQTRAIHTLQRQQRTLEGLLARKTQARIVQQHQNAQRLIKPLAVRNPYADHLTFPDERTRLRRDHEKYLTLIDTIALLHQYQRPIQGMIHDGETFEYVEVALADIEVANRLAHEALGRSLDELPPQTRRLLTLIEAMVREACAQRSMVRPDYRFSRRDVREHTRWSDFQVKMHMHKLEELEYVLVHRGGRGQSFVYELLYDGQGRDGSPFLMGLVDIERLRHAYDKKKEHPKSNWEPSSSPQGAGQEPGSSEGKRTVNALPDAASATARCAATQNAHPEDPSRERCYDPKQSNKHQAA